MNKKETNVFTLKKYADMGDVVELQGWEPDEPFVVKLRRCCLRNMIIAGKIPNPLMAAAQKLYEGERSRANPSIVDTLKAMEIVVIDAMVSPTYAQVREAGVELTEEQFGAIFLYSQRGAAAIEPFRFKPTNPGSDSGGQEVADKAE